MPTMHQIINSSGKKLTFTQLKSLNSQSHNVGDFSHTRHYTYLNKK
jgi:hypothetical protein